LYIYTSHSDLKHLSVFCPVKSGGVGVGRDVCPEKQASSA